MAVTNDRNHKLSQFFVLSCRLLCLGVLRRFGLVQIVSFFLSTKKSNSVGSFVPNIHVVVVAVDVDGGTICCVKCEVHFKVDAMVVVISILSVRYGETDVYLCMPQGARCVCVCVCVCVRMANPSLFHSFSTRTRTCDCQRALLRYPRQKEKVLVEEEGVTLSGHRLMVTTCLLSTWTLLWLPLPSSLRTSRFRRL